VLPVIGGALVWVPAAIVLVIQGAWVKALILSGFCSIVIGSIDNVLRPRLVGHDTKMSDLLILFSTLGGIAGFGAIGFIIGPIIAALFVTTWQIFGRAYRDDLDVEP
jgi:predicted PurR-regulated permease PerM